VRSSISEESQENLGSDRQDGNTSGIDLEKLADKVYDLMRSELRLSRVRGQRSMKQEETGRWRPLWE